MKKLKISILICSALILFTATGTRAQANLNNSQTAPNSGANDIAAMCRAINESNSDFKCVSQESINEGARAMRREPELEAKIAGFERGARIDQTEIDRLKLQVKETQENRDAQVKEKAAEAKELREMVKDLVKSARGSGSGICIGIKFR